MARVLAIEVKDIIKTNKTDSNLATFINIANRFVTDVLGSKGMSSARLKDIELFLTAHIIKVDIEKGGVKSERIGDSQRTYNIMTGNSLQSSSYGQTASMLDTSGTLLSVNIKSAVFRVL